jgi:hypothetical protein
VAVSVESG